MKNRVIGFDYGPEIIGRIVIMHNQKRASIIIIAYNDEAHIERAVKSACAQTESNIEIICVDDGSTDSTYDLMLQCAEFDERIKLIRQSNKGSLGARYAGLQQAEGEYILLLDSDDVLLPEAVNTACTAADELGSDVLEFGVSIVKSENDPPSDYIWSFFETWFSQSGIATPSAERKELLNACFKECALKWNIFNKLYKADLLREAMRFYQDEWVSMREDMLCTLMVLLHTKSYARIPDRLYQYTVGGGVSTKEGSLLTSREIKTWATGWMSLKLAREWIRKGGFQDDEVSDVMEYYASAIQESTINVLLGRCTADNRTEFLDFLSQCCTKEDLNYVTSECINRQQMRIAELDVHNRELTELSERSQMRIDELDTQNRYYKESFDIITNSTSWKITKPVRTVLDYLKGQSKREIERERSAEHLARQKSEEEFAKPSEKKPETIAEFQSIDGMLKACYEGGHIVYAEEKLRDNMNSGRDSVLIISHELNLTGAPIVLTFMADWFVEKGLDPVVISRYDGPLAETFSNKGIPVIINDNIYNSDFAVKCAPLFSMVVVNTALGAPVVAQMSGMNLPVLWWIHEARASYLNDPTLLQHMPEYVKENIHICCVSRHAEKILREYRPGYCTRQLAYYIPDYGKMPVTAPCPLVTNADKKVFVCIGAMEERKGHGILAEAIRMLTPDERNACHFVFVGRQNHLSVFTAIEDAIFDYPDLITYIPVLDRESISALYQKMDCLVCPSKDDPLPTTVTEAMSFSKLIICSENTGSAALIEKSKGGLIYRNDNPAELADCLRKVIRGGDELHRIKLHARQTYEECFTKDVFSRNMEQLYRVITAKQAFPVDVKVSVVIPTFNGEKYLPGLLTKLSNQIGVSEIETIVVDSGSTDDTIAIAEGFGAKIIQISQDEFSHSYARNLGAKHASGEYLLFMTQDAEPGNEYWIRDMAQPILTDLAVAVSCKENPREDCDLYGRYSLWFHTKYMGILEHDRLLSMPAMYDYNTMRKNGQLNDVACLIRSDVFSQFEYRGSYAEDLDLGLRLIKSGYRLYLLSGVSVIHSHTRPPFYHLKRGFVDITTLKQLFPDFPAESVTAGTTINRIIVMVAALCHYVSELTESKNIPTDTESFFDWSDRFFDAEREKLKTMSYGDFEPIVCQEIPLCDRQFHDFVKDIYSHGSESFSVDTYWMDTHRKIIEKELKKYLAYSGEPITKETIEGIATVFVKQCSWFAGETLAHYMTAHGHEESFLKDLACELQRGV